MKVSALFLLILAGCATQRLTVWDKPGATQIAYDKDHRECVYDAAKIAIQEKNIFIGHDKGVYLREGCMKSRGWEKRGL